VTALTITAIAIWYLLVGIAIYDLAKENLLLLGNRIDPKLRLLVGCLLLWPIVMPIGAVVWVKNRISEWSNNE